jgi:hypothetical protein
VLRWLGRGRPDGFPRARLEAGRLWIEDVPEAWPPELVVRDRREGGRRESVLLAGDGPLVDPTTQRAGPWPWPQPSGALLELYARGESADSPLAVVPLAPSPPEEFRRPRRRVEADPPPPLREPSAHSAGGARAPHPWGLTVLGVGLALVAAAGLAWGRR